MELIDLAEDNKNKTVEYTNSILELVKMIVGRIAIIQFRTFCDTHKVDPNEKDGVKVNITHFKTLAGDIAKEAYDSLNRDNFSLDDTLFTEGFYNNYIIQTSFLIVKELAANLVEDWEEFSS
jgi:hypothetical protein